MYDYDMHMWALKLTYSNMQASARSFINTSKHIHACTCAHHPHLLEWSGVKVVEFLEIRTTTNQQISKLKYRHASKYAQAHLTHVLLHDSTYCHVLLWIVVHFYAHRCSTINCCAPLPTIVVYYDVALRITMHYYATVCVSTHYCIRLCSTMCCYARLCATMLYYDVIFALVHCHALLCTTTH